MDTDALIDAVVEWGEERGIDNPWTQASKVTEEWGETVSEMNHGRFGDDFEDGIGDTLVSLIIYAHICGKDIRECLEEAYVEISNRTGKTVNGNFIKDTNGEN